MNQFKLFIRVMFLFPVLVSAQEKSEILPKPIEGSPIIRVFANLHSGITNTDQSRAFEVRRAYLGYRQDLNEHFSTEIKVDIGSPEEISEYARLRRYAYFKTAALYWEKNKFTIKGGIIDTEHYRRQEKWWKHRYVYRSFQDEHRFGPKADLGTTILYRPSRKIELDASMMNGEGYTNLQQDNAFKVSLGISYILFDRLVFRVYFDAIEQDKVQSTLSSFIGYRHNRITAGAEYNRKMNNNYREGYHQNGLSSYISYDVNKHWEVFSRYDVLRSNIPDEYDRPWNLHNDGSAIIAGIQYMPITHVKLALNYQDWVPYASNLNKEAYIFLNLEVTY